MHLEEQSHEHETNLRNATSASSVLPIEANENTFVSNSPTCSHTIYKLKKQFIGTQNSALI